MNLKNYTSSVPSINSISKIESKLAEAGATHIAKSYENNRPVGMIFQIMIGDKPMTFKLPAKVDKVYDYMINGKRRTNLKSVRDTTKRQADMTAWKILAEWIEIQLSMIKLEQAEAIELFLPYAYDGRTDKTLFEKMKENNYKLLTQ